ncbi:MAG: hypothetical protein JWQ04_891 [Pedosphaera sp.]|nr:hypothetical protein [Pedosphaera sp.]
MSLRKPLAALICNQWAMIKCRWSKFQRAIKQDLPSCGQQQIRAAHDFGDFHCGVIHHHRQLIRRDAIVSPYNKIAKIFSGDKLLRAEVTIGERNGLAVGNPEAPCGGLIFNLRLLLGTACSGIDNFIIGRMWRGGGGLEVFARARAGIDEIAGAKFFKSGGI